MQRVPRPGRNGLSVVRLYLELGVPIWQPQRQRDNAGLDQLQRRAASPSSVLTLGSLPVDSWPHLALGSHPFSPTRPCLLTTSRPPRWPDFTHHFCPNFRFEGGSNGASHLLNGPRPWHPGSWVLILAWPLIYHSLKLSYLLPYLLSASSLWNASSMRTGTSPLRYPWLPRQSPAQSRRSGHVC